MRIITISREFGSGGRELGKRLAEELGIAYYDKEIISAIAEKSDLDEAYVEKAVESGVLSRYPLTFSSTFAHVPIMLNYDTKLIQSQRKVILELASRGDCVIVGRNADTILADMKPLRIFVYADMEARVARCVKKAKKDEEKITPVEIEKMIKQIDKTRRRNFDFASDYEWGDKRGYDLCVNTTHAEIKKLVPNIASYAKAWFEGKDE